MQDQGRVKSGWYTPMLHVADIERSIEFYHLLGFQTVDDDGCKPLSWARMHCEGGAVMFLRAEGPFDTSQVPVVFVLYCPDLPRLREQISAAGTPVGPIHYPEYMPSGALDLADPDGYRISINQWSNVEHEAWLERLKARGTTDL